MWSVLAGVWLGFAIDALAEGDFAMAVLWMVGPVVTFLMSRRR
jgi:hypothetical protein